MKFLTSHEMETIVVEVVTGKPPSLKTPEAMKFRSAIEKDVASIKAKGGVVDLPPEIHVSGLEE